MSRTYMLHIEYVCQTCWFKEASARQGDGSVDQAGPSMVEQEDIDSCCLAQQPAAERTKHYHFPAPTNLKADTVTQFKSQEIDKKSCFEHLRKAKNKTAEALRSIEIAEHKYGGNVAALREAYASLWTNAGPWAHGAANAQQLVRTVLPNCPHEAEEAVRKADRDVRDVVVLTCSSFCQQTQDRDEFLRYAALSYGGELSNEIRASLLLAYHKEPYHKMVVSNNQVSNSKRSKPRTRRRPPSPSKRFEAASKEAKLLFSEHVPDTSSSVAVSQPASLWFAREDPSYLPQAQARWQDCDPPMHSDSACNIYNQVPLKLQPFNTMFELQRSLY